MSMVLSPVVMGEKIRSSPCDLKLGSGVEWNLE